MLRDILFILAVIICITISLSGRGHPYLRQQFKYPLEIQRYRNRNYPAIDERLPSPIVLDIDGDGINEIIVATRTPRLLLLHAPNSNDPTGLPVTIRSVSLLGSTRSVGSRHPVALSTGYLDPATTTGERKRFIVVVLTSWTVLCFDHRLKLQWETSASRIQTVLSIGPLVHREVATLISSISIVKGDRGVVIVGGSMMLRDGVDDGTFEISGDRVQEDTDGSDSQDYASEVLLQKTRDEYYGKVKRAEHFNYFAFDGKTGAVRWKHEDGPNMEQEDLTPDDMDVGSKENGYRMTKADLRHMNVDGGGSGSSSKSGNGDNEEDRTTMNWKEFRSSVLHSLPHTWSERSDTSLNVAHYSRDRHHRKSTKWTSHLSSSTNPTKASSSSSSHYETDTKEAMKKSSNHLLTQNRNQHLLDPNVIVAHTRRGLEVLHVYTGRTVTRVPMPETRFGGGSGAYVDVNGDRVIDHVQGIPGLEEEENIESGSKNEGAAADQNDIEAEEEEEEDVSETISQKGRNHGRSSHYNVPSCWVQTVSGIPPLEQIWEGSLCGDSHTNGDNGNNGENGASDGSISNRMMQTAVEEPNGGAVRDVNDRARVVPPLFLRHRGAVNGRPKAVRPFDVVMLVSTGVMTKYGPTGNVVWQTNTDSKWHRDPFAHRNTPRDVDAFAPSTVAMALDANNKNNQNINHHDNNDNDQNTYLSSNQNDVEMIVGVGDTHLVLVSMESGAQMERVELSAPPTGNVVVGDFNNDEMNDIIVVTRNGIYGYVTQTTIRSRFTFILLIFVLMMIGFLVVLQVFGLLSDVDHEIENQTHSDYRGKWRQHQNGFQESKRVVKSKRAMD